MFVANILHLTKSAKIAKIPRRSLVSSSLTLHCIHYSFKFVNTGSEISLQKDFRSINDDVRRVNEHQGTLTVQLITSGKSNYKECINKF